MARIKGAMATRKRRKKVLKAAKGYYGGVVSAPVFRNVIEGALRLDDVPPDDLQSWLAANSKAKTPAVQPVRSVTP